MMASVRLRVPGEFQRRELQLLAAVDIEAPPRDRAELERLVLDEDLTFHRVQST